MNEREAFEKERLQETYLRRKETYEQYKDFIKGWNDKGKGSRYRKWLKNILYGLSTRPFETEDEEYKFIGKYGRGLFRYGDMENSFDEEKQKILVEIARGYGAFDY